MRKKNIIMSAVAASFLTVGAFVAPALADEMKEAAADSMSETGILYAGQWTKKSFKVSGDWSIVRKGDKTYVELSEDFKTRRAPDLKIFLSPLAAAATNGSNATNGSVLIAPLSSNKGAQMYEISASVDIASFKSILIHCEAYSKLWSAADLIQTS